MTVGRTFLSVLLGAGSLALVTSAPAAAAGVPGSTSTTFAGYGATSTATTVSALVMVPTVECTGVAPGTVAGQDTGVHLDSSGVQVTADVRTYCTGHQAKYQTEFVLPRTAGDTFIPAKITVSPNDVVFMSVTTSTSGSVARMQDLTTGSAASHAKGLALASANPYAVMTQIAENATGGILVRGLPPAGTPYLPGPETSSATVLRQVKVDGQPLGSTAGLTQVTWVSSTGQVLVTPTAISQNGLGFGLEVVQSGQLSAR